VSDGVAHSLTEVLAPSPVVVLPLVGTTLAGVWNDIRTVASIIERRDIGGRLLTSLDARIQQVHETLRAAHAHRPRVAVIEWLDPLFAAAHWSPELVRRAGGIDVLSEPGAHSAQISIEQLRRGTPEILVFAPCGFDVRRATEDARALLTQPDWEWTRELRCWALDGNALTSRPGPRLADAIETLASIIAPELFEAPAPRYARMLR
jgi:iron complex transport system substrate-binding protein